jgi:hypothetical protein
MRGNNVSWHTITVGREGMTDALAQIRGAGGTVVRCRPMRTRCFVTYVTSRA